MTTKLRKTVDLEATVYSQEGKKSGTTKLPEGVFGLAWNADLVHQVVVGMQANAHISSAHAKDRSEVRGGGKKPWAQKGTGRARHGSSRSPIWRKGGVTHGPRNDRDYSQKLNRKMRVKALFTVLAKKFADGEVLFVDKFTLADTKATLAKKAMQSLGTISGYEGVATRRKNAVLFALPKADTMVKKSFGNFGNVVVSTAKELNPLDVMTYKYLVVVDPEESTKIIESKMK